MKRIHCLEVFISCFVIGISSLGIAEHIPQGFEEAYDHGERLFPFLSHDSYGYINAWGDIIIEPQYRWASRFNDGYAIVMKEFDDEMQGRVNDWKRRDYGIIDEKNEYIVPLLYAASISRVAEKVYDVREHGSRVGWIDLRGEAPSFCDFRPDDVIYNEMLRADDLRYVAKLGALLFDKMDCDDACQYEDYIVVNKEGLYGILDKDGHYISTPPMAVDNLLPIGDGLFAYSDKGKMGIINAQGNIISVAQWDYIDYVSDDMICVTYNTYRKMYLNTYGQIIIRDPPIGSPFCNGLATREGVIMNKRGEILLDVNGRCKKSYGCSPIDTFDRIVVGMAQDPYRLSQQQERRWPDLDDEQDVSRFQEAKYIYYPEIDLVMQKTGVNHKRDADGVYFSEGVPGYLGTISIYSSNTCNRSDLEDLDEGQTKACIDFLWNEATILCQTLSIEGQVIICREREYQRTIKNGVNDYSEEKYYAYDAFRLIDGIWIHLEFERPVNISAPGGSKIDSEEMAEVYQWFVNVSARKSIEGEDFESEYENDYEDTHKIYYVFSIEGDELDTEKDPARAKELFDLDLSGEEFEFLREENV